jgi:DNA-binding transcriptional MerR regulator
MNADDDADLGPGVPDKLFFRIGEIGEIVGVEPHVLRYWEGEFKIRPQRSTSGQRMYRRKDLAKFLRIKKLLHDEGYTIAGARKALSEGTDDHVPVDDGRVREVVERLEGVRARIRVLQERVAHEGVAGLDRGR